MKTKIIQFIPALLALMVIGFRYFSLWCINSVSSCYGTWVHQIALEITKPLFYFSVFFLPIAIILMLIQRNIFNSWLKLAVWAIPLSILYIATIPVIDNSFLPFHRDDAARLVGEVFAAASLALIIWKSVSSHRRSI
jgi:hypothetical protein